MIPGLIRALALTTAIEVALARQLFAVREAPALAVVALAQVATNPLVNVCARALGWSLDAGAGVWAGVFALEAAAVVAEGALYRYAQASDRPWRMSLALNAASFTCGLMLAAIARLAS